MRNTILVIVLFFILSSYTQDSFNFNLLKIYNILEGKDLAVIGTPHIKSIQYLLYAKALDIKISPHDFKMNLSRVIHNDLEFRIVTFNKKELQWIQFHFIEEQIKQAIGRGRALRNMIIVYFHSSYPLPESCLTEKEKYIGLCKLNRNYS